VFLKVVNLFKDIKKRKVVKSLSMMACFKWVKY